MEVELREPPHHATLFMDDTLQPLEDSPPHTGKHCPSCLCRADMKKAIVMERQWELEIMTASTKF